MSEETKVIYTFAKNAQEEVRASLNTYRGKQYLDLRVYYKTDEGEYKPTKKGLALSPDLLDDLEEAVRKLREAVS